jgi:hypothetical protein
MKKLDGMDVNSRRNPEKTTSKIARSSGGWRVNEIILSAITSRSVGPRALSGSRCAMKPM